MEKLQLAAALSRSAAGNRSHEESSKTMDLKFLPLSVECTDGPPPDVESLPHPLCAPGFEGYHSNSWPRVDLWGTLPTGQRATVHVHGCFPYFYARPLEEDAEAVRAFSVDPNLLRSICKRTAEGLDEMLRKGDGASRVLRLRFHRTDNHAPGFFYCRPCYYYKPERVG